MNTLRRTPYKASKEEIKQLNKQYNYAKNYFRALPKLKSMQEELEENDLF